MVNAAGVLFVCGDRVLLVRRSAEVDAPGLWATPGGKIEDGETAEEAAIRECREELGAVPDGDMALFARRNDGAVDYQTFLQTVDAPFNPVLNEEHDGFVWADPANPPLPLHPGAAVVLAKLTANELDIARMIAAGDLTSPQRYHNVTLWAIRITGTGAVYRRQKKEYAFRHPEHYLTPEFLARCNGLPVIFEHPESGALNSEEFLNRIVGTIFLPYIKGDEVWGIAKIFDDATISILENEQLSTSPMVVLSGEPGDDEYETLEDGTRVLLESHPSLVDHIAVCDAGVFDKLGAPSGVDSATAGESAVADEKKDDDMEMMDKAKKDAEEKEAKEKADKFRKDADEKEKMEREDRARKDAETQGTLDKIVSCMDSMMKRMDAWEKKKADAENKEAREIEEEGKVTPEKVTADKAKKDAEEDEEKKKEEEKKAKEKADSDVAILRTLADINRKVEDVRGKLPKDVNDDDYREISDAQARADGIENGFGRTAPRPLQGETAMQYRKRYAATIKQHSRDFKDVDIYAVSDPKLWKVIEDRIYADAMHAAEHPTDVPVGRLREVTRTNPQTGQRMTTFHGSTTFIQQLKMPGRSVIGFGSPNKAA